jgi:hypothetical protein
MIAPSGLLLVVTTYAIPVTVLLVGDAKIKTAKLRHLILLSRVTYRAGGEDGLSAFRRKRSLLQIHLEKSV